VIDKATEIEVILNDNSKYSAHVVGADPSTDVAILKINAPNLKPISLGNSDDLRVGEWVLAVGNPFNLTSTVTAGIVSAKARNINLLADRTNQNVVPIESFIQTDAAVNPGNSGGALVNTKGELVGINTAIASQTGSYSGYSFAIPVNLVQKIMRDIIDYGIVQRGFLGVQIADISQELKEKNREIYVIISNAKNAEIRFLNELNKLNPTHNLHRNWNLTKNEQAIIDENITIISKLEEIKSKIDPHFRTLIIHLDIIRKIPKITYIDSRTSKTKDRLDNIESEVTTIRTSVSELLFKLEQYNLGYNEIKEQYNREMNHETYKIIHKTTTNPAAGIISKEHEDTAEILSLPKKIDKLLEFIRLNKNLNIQLGTFFDCYIFMLDNILLKIKKQNIDYKICNITDDSKIEINNNLIRNATNHELLFLYKGIYAQIITPYKSYFDSINNKIGRTHIENQLFTLYDEIIKCPID
jgi:hypothetical protein